jgi:uncharacterized protein (TIGR00266 family)
VEERIHGTTMPVLELVLGPGEGVFAESGELSWMSSTVAMRTTTQYGGGGGVVGSIRRLVGGGKLWMTSYTAEAGPGTVAFATKTVGQIVPVDVAPQPGMSFLGHRQMFLAGTHGVELSWGFQQSFGAGVFGGDGFRLQRIAGSGRAWIELSGEVVVYDLKPGESMRVHPGHVGMFQDTVSFGITRIKGIRNLFFGADGIFLADLTGPGRIWLQSLPLSRLAHALAPYLAADPAMNPATRGAERS